MHSVKSTHEFIICLNTRLFLTRNKPDGSAASVIQESGTCLHVKTGKKEEEEEVQMTPSVNSDGNLLQLANKAFTVSQL